MEHGLDGVKLEPNWSGLWTGVDQNEEEFTVDQSGQWTGLWTGMDHEEWSGVHQWTGVDWSMN